MENERENTRDQNEGSGQQQPLDQQQNDNSQQDQLRQGQQPLGEKGELGTQELGQDQGEISTLSEEGQQQQTSQGDAGFVGSQGQDSGEYLQQDGNPESDQGDIERDRERSENRDSDIEGSSDNS